MDTTRRQALGTLGLALGTGLVGGSLVAARAVASAPEKGPKALPWPYHKLDPEAAGERGYQGYLKLHCCYGAFAAIIGELGDRHGAPYNAFPFEMMEFGQGGVVGWASLCGALLGAAAAIQLVSPDPKAAIDELYRWHEVSELPDYRPRSPKFEIGKSVADSVLCHVSVTKWCEATGTKAFDKKRSDRCGWITGSVARKAVQILNAQADGAFAAAFPLSAETQNCRGCHDKGGELEDTRGKMDCLQCHPGVKIDHPVPLQQVKK